MTTTIITGPPGCGKNTKVFHLIGETFDQAFMVGSLANLNKDPYWVLKTLLKAHDLKKSSVIFDEVPADELEKLLLSILSCPSVVDVYVLSQVCPGDPEFKMLKHFEPFTTQIQLP